MREREKVREREGKQTGVHCRQVGNSEEESVAIKKTERPVPVFSLDVYRGIVQSGGGTLSCDLTNATLFI